MANINFDDLLAVLKTQIGDLAQTTVTNYVNEAKADGISILNTSKSKLEQWTNQLLNNSLSKSEFEWLVCSQKDVIQMDALKNAGLAQISVDTFKDAVLSLIVSTVFNLIPG